MRILHVQKVKGIGGSERHLLALLPALTAVGDDVRMVVLSAGEDEGRFSDAAHEAGIDVRQVSAGRDADPRAVPALVREIRRFQPDLVHSHLVHADLWGQIAARRVGVSGVRSCHNVSARYRREPGRAAGRLAGRLAVRTIAISRYVAGFVRELRLAPPERIRVVPYGIDAASWQVDERERDRERAGYGLDRDEVVVGIAGRLIEGKGHRQALDAVGRVIGDAPSLRVLVAGDGPLAEELRSRARSLPEGAVRFLGHRDDMPRFLAACDVLVFPTQPSLGEGFGLAALEAMAAGRPVIAADVAALPEVVASGETGLVVPPDAGSLASAIEALVADPERRAQMGEAGRARAIREFSLDAMVAGTRAVYAEALAR